MTAQSSLTLASALNPPGEPGEDYLDELGRWADEQTAKVAAIPEPGLVDWQGEPIPEPDTKLGPAETRALLDSAEVRAICERTGAKPLSLIPRDPPPPLLLDRLDAQEATILYGNGGAGKGTITASWISGLVTSGHRVMVVDYEHHPYEWSSRTASLGGVETLAEVVYVSPVARSWQGARGAIWDAADDLAELAERTECSYVVVDSAVTACGATNPLDPEAPGQYFGAIARIGLPSLTLAHVTGAGDLTKPFGSVFWHNLARVTWSVSRVGNEGHQVLLQHRKDNNHERQSKCLVTVEWWRDLPRAVLETPYSARLGDLIRDALTDGPLTVTELVGRLNEESDEGEPTAKADSVRAALRRGIKATPKLFTVTGKGAAARFANVP